MRYINLRFTLLLLYFTSVIERHNMSVSASARSAAVSATVSCNSVQLSVMLGSQS